MESPVEKSEQGPCSAAVHEESTACAQIQDQGKLASM